VSSPAELSFARAREEPRLRVLVIEDDPNDAELVQACLAEAARGGAEIVHAATLAQGLDALQSQAFHVTVLDLDLPDSSGFDTLEKVGAAARSPIIVVTGNPHPALATEALKRRAYEVLPKSELEPRSLMRIVRLASLHGGGERPRQLAERRYPLIDNSREAIALFGARAELLYANPAMRRTLWNEPSLIELAHPTEREAVQSQYARLAAAGEGRLTLKAHFRHHDGGWRMLEVALDNLLQDGDVAAVVASFSDITSQADLEQRFRTTFDQAAVGIAHVAEDGRFQLVNRKLCQILGYTREELGALTVSDVSHPDDRGVAHALRRKMRAHEIDSFSVIKRYLRKDGTSVWAEVTVSLVRAADGAPNYEIALFEDISARRHAEDALQRSEQRFRALIENSSDGILLTDREARITYGSPGARRTLGHEKGETLGWQIADMVHPQDRAIFERMAASAAAHPGVTQPLRARVRHKSARYRLLEGTCTDLCADESVRAVVYNFRDVTVREQALARARRVSMMYAALSAANEVSAQLKDEQQLYQRICDIAVQFGGMRLASVRLLNPATKWLEPCGCAGDAATYLRGARISVDSALAEGQGLAGPAMRENRTVVCNDFVAEPRLAPWHEGARCFGFAAVACVPLRRAGAAIGLLILYSAETDYFDPELVTLVERLAANVGYALDRLDAERELRESEERFRNLTELSSDWYWEQDEGLRFTRLYGGFFACFQIEPQTLLGKLRWEIHGVDTGGAEWKAHREVLAQRESFRDFEYPIRLPGGDWGYVSVSGQAVFNEAGIFRGYRGIGRDITARRRAEEQLRRFRAALNASAESIFLVDADALQIIDLNDAAAHLLGYEREAMIGANPAIMFEGRDDAHVRAEYERLTANPDAAQSFRAHFRRRDGTLVPVEGSRRLLRASGRNYVVGIARDITERLKAEERLQQSLERFEIVARATNDVVWDWNLVTDQLWWNDNFCSVFGYGPADVGAYIDSWTERIHPEDAARVKRDIKSAIERGERVWTAEYRFRRKDGSYANVFDRGLPLRDGAGRPVRMIGAMVDITERKRAERKMALHAQRQEIIARLGQFALGGADLEQVFAEAARVLRAGGCDVAAIIERVGERGYEFMVRAARGEEAEASVGKSKVLPAHSKWATLLDSGGGAVEHDRKYFEARDTDRPWSFWLRRLGSGVYAPIRSETGPFGILMMGSLRDTAFDTEDLSFAEAIAHVLSTAVRGHHTQTRLAYMAEFDTLTGLPNRNLLQDRLNQSLAQARRRQWQGAVLFIDLDRFKLINDTLGHHFGDHLIAEVGRRIRQSVRGGDTVGRVSGDEFGVVLTDLAQADDAAIVAQKILDALAPPFDLGGHETYVTASIGISVFPADGDDAQTLLKNADMAMYRAKELTRNAYCFFTAEMNQRSVAKLQLNTDLRHAIERGEFALHYQPKVDLRDGRIHGVEALLRWNHPQRGMVVPDEFIPALEDSGLILQVGEWVLGEAARQLGAWRHEGLELVPVAVNLSAKQFRRRDLDALIRGVLAVTEVPLGLIELEITESCLMDEPEEALRLLANLRAAGLKISVDDFGTGYSSLSYLTRLPLTALKIDRSFVRNVATSGQAASIVRAVIDMAHNLGFTVIAEGVETEEQAAFLRHHGCDLGQGFLFDEPMPAAELARRLRRVA
jgi:diguanylate cyclase (GGDEF)-like protein/PAS domain S-box-containing protein